MTNVNIDLSKEIKIGSKVFSGRLMGEELRIKYLLDEEDKIKEKVFIKFPKDTFSLNASFFLGMFGKSVIALGEEAFKNKYIFDCNDTIHKSIEDGINRALKSALKGSLKSSKKSSNVLRR